MVNCIHNTPFNYIKFQNQIKILNKINAFYNFFLILFIHIQLFAQQRKSPGGAVAYQDHLNRLKYFESYPNDPRPYHGIYNMGRNISFKIDILIH